MLWRVTPADPPSPAWDSGVMLTRVSRGPSASPSIPGLPTSRLHTGLLQSPGEERQPNLGTYPYSEGKRLTFHKARSAPLTGLIMLFTFFATLSMPHFFSYILNVTWIKRGKGWGLLGCIWGDPDLWWWGQVTTWMQIETERHPEDHECPRSLAEVGCLDRLEVSLETHCLFSWQSSSAAPGKFWNSLAMLI